MSRFLPVEVESSVIRRVLYVGVGEVLYVEFVKSGDVYRYEPVPARLYDELVAADSVGSYFTQYIRKEYQGVKVDRDWWREALENLRPKPIPPQEFIEQFKRHGRCVGF